MKDLKSIIDKSIGVKRRADSSNSPTKKKLKDYRSST